MADVDDWAARLPLLDVSVDGNVVTGSAKGVISVEVPPAPPQVVLELRDVGTGGSRQFSIYRPPKDPPSEIRVFAGPLLERLQVLRDEGPRLPLLRVDGRVDRGTHGAGPITIAGEVVERLELIGRVFSVDKGVSPQILLDSAAVGFSTDARIKRLELRRVVSFPTRLVADEIVAHDRVEIRLSGGHSEQPKIIGVHGGRARFSLTGNAALTLAEIAPSSEVELKGDAVLDVSGTANDVVVTGAGTFLARGRITGAQLRPSAGDLTLHVRGEIDGSGGPVVLTVEPEGVCLGRDDPPLRVKRVGRVDAAEIENVSLFDLERLTDLAALESATRFTPWMPRRSSLGWIPGRPLLTSEMADTMRLGGTSSEDQTARLRQAHFWNRLRSVLTTTHASGGTQSEVRYQATRARRRALPRGREKWLLRFFALVGYGERIMSPLLWLAYLALIGSMVIVAPPGDGDCCGAAARFFVTWGQLILSPLAFFRFVDPPKVEPGFETGVLVTIRIVGILLLFFALSAARRVAKAE